MKKTRFISLLTLLAVCAMALPGTAMAHGVWFARRSDRIQLVCGEGWKDNAYDPDGLPSDDLAAVYLEMDYGYWSNNADGEWIPKPMDEVEGSTIGTHALKYSMNYFKPVTEVKALDGVLYQFVPSVDPSTLNVGDEFTVQLLNNGEPMADVDIIPDVLNHHTETIKTDENGMATVTASNGGVNVIGCEMVVPYENEGVDQKATRSKVFVSLSFTLYPEEED